MLYALVPIIFLSLLSGAKADYIGENFIFQCNEEHSKTVTAEQIGLPNGQYDPLTLPDGTKLVGFHQPPNNASHPLIIYFHGNGGFRGHHFTELAGHGYGVMAYAYRCYHGSGGRPNEANVLQDAEEIYKKARATYPAATIVIMGESIGSGVATILASRHEEAALVLDSPYDNIPMVASTGDFLPLPLPVYFLDRLIADKFHADDAIGRVKAPVFMSAGCADKLILPARSEALYARANSPKKLIIGAHDKHVPLSSSQDMMAKTIAWIDHPSAGDEAEGCPK